MLSAYIQEAGITRPGKAGMTGRYRIAESRRFRVNPVSEWISGPFRGGWIIAFFNAIESTLRRRMCRTKVFGLLVGWEP